MGCGGDWISVTPPERRAEQIARQTYRVADRTLTISRKNDGDRIPRRMSMRFRIGWLSPWRETSDGGFQPAAVANSRS
jgi:hypothetical protein